MKKKLKKKMKSSTNAVRYFSGEGSLISTGSISVGGGWSVPCYTHC